MVLHGIDWHVRNDSALIEQSYFFCLRLMIIYKP
jgi:hypothetical protein